MEVTVTIATRRVLLGMVAGLAASAVAGCGSSTSDQDAAPAGAIRVEGAFGPTELPRPPRRVVALGLGPDTDALLDLGVPPIAMRRNPEVPEGILPWQTGGDHPPPVLLNSTQGTPFEAIAAQAPDLIVATTQYSLPADHSRLATIAPVLAYARAPNTDTWQDTTRRVAAALGRTGAAEPVIADVNERIARARASHPTLVGRTFTSGPVTADGTIYTTRTADDLSARFYEQLGLVLAPQVQTLPPSGTPGKAMISPERIGLIDADLVLLGYHPPDPGLRARTESGPLFSQLPAVRRGSYVVVDVAPGLATAFPSARSLRYALERSVDRLAAAVR